MTESVRAKAADAGASLAVRLGAYEAVIDDSSSEPSRLESAVSSRWPQPRDAIDWYYRAVALSRLGRRQDALDAYARAAELAPFWTRRSSSEQEPAPPSALAGVSRGEPRPPTSQDQFLPSPVVTLVGTRNHDCALSGIVVAVDVEETGPSAPPEPVPLDTAVEPPPPGADQTAPVVGLEGGENPGSSQPSVTREAVPGYARSAPIRDSDAETEPQDSSDWYYRGVTLARMQRFEEALKAYERAVEADDCNGAAWHYLGITLARLGSHSDALAAYARALELDGRNAAIWINYAMSLTQLGRHAQAQAAHDQALKLDSPQEQRASRGVPGIGALVRASRSRISRSHRRRWH